MTSDYKNKKILEKFGQVLRHKRIKRGLTQEALGELADIHRTYIAGIESGRRNPSLKNIYIDFQKL